VQSTLAKLSLCRTAALGGHRWRCQSCDAESPVYNSCGDRHCPQCGGAKRANWLDSAAKLLQPGVDYYQVIFTIPQQLSSLALGNRRVMFDLLFRSAWRVLQQTIATEQRFEAAALMVLHTWNQKLEAHAHVHALVPGGGPSLDTDPSGDAPRRWIRSQRAGDSGSAGYYLVNADTLRQRFRDVFLKGLKRLHRSDKLKLRGEWSWLKDEAAFADWLKPLAEIAWVAHIEPPPCELASPENVLKYLARYLTGGPISDRRLISEENGTVTFSARRGTTRGGDRCDVEECPLPGIEFVRRWCLHILPKGYTKTRRFGGYSNCHRKRYLAECEALLTAKGIDFASVLPSADNDVHHEADAASAESGLRCPQCDRPMVRVASSTRPSWVDVMRGSQRPSWYARQDSWPGPVGTGAARASPQLSEPSRPP